MEFVYFFVYIAIGLLFDWALYGRIVATLGMPGFYGSGDGYTDHLFPRIILTLVATVIIFCAGKGNDVNATMLISGSVIFALSNFYGVYRYLSGR